MAIQSIPRRYDYEHDKEISDMLSEGVQGYFKGKSDKKKRKKNEKKIEAALLAEGESKDVAKALSRLDPKSFSEVYRAKQLIKLEESKQSANQAIQKQKDKKKQEQEAYMSGVLQSRGFPKDEADAIVKGGPQAVKAALSDENYQAGAAPMPDVAWQQQLRDPNQGTIGSALGMGTQQPAQQPQMPLPMQQPQEPMGQAGPTQEQEQALQATSLQGMTPQAEPSRMFSKSDPTQVKELRNLYKETLKDPKFPKESANRLFDMLGVDEESKNIITATEMNLKAFSYFTKLAKGDEKQAVKIARSYGLNKLGPDMIPHFEKLANGNMKEALKIARSYGFLVGKG